MKNLGDAKPENINWEKAKEIFAPEKESFLKKAKDTWEKYPQAEEVLKVLAGVGVVSLMVLTPGLAPLIGGVARSREKYRYRRMWKRWEKQKLIEIKETPEGTVVEITQEGVKKALRYKLEELKIKKPITWDKKWRVVIFDVPEEKRRNRDFFRENLQRIGFYQLNESVFVFPHPCFDEVEYLRQISGIGEEVTYLTAESIETGPNLKTHFGL